MSGGIGDFNIRKALLPNPKDLFKGKPLDRLDPTKFAGSPIQKKKEAATPAAPDAGAVKKARRNRSLLSRARRTSESARAQTLG